MNIPEAWLQALERLIVVFVCGGIAAILATNFAPLQTVLGQYEPLVVPILTAVLQGILKALGGPTVPLAAVKVAVTSIASSDRPHWWSV